MSDKFKIEVKIEVNDGLKDKIKLKPKTYTKTWEKKKFIRFDKKLKAYILKSNVKNKETFNFLNECKLKYIVDGFKGFPLDKIAKAISVLFEDGFTKVDHIILNVLVIFTFPNMKEDKSDELRVETIQLPIKIRSLMNLIQNEHILKNEKDLVRKNNLKREVKLKIVPDMIIFVKDK